MQVFTRVNRASQSIYADPGRDESRNNVTGQDSSISCSVTTLEGSRNHVETLQRKNEVRIGHKRWLADKCLDNIDHTTEFSEFSTQNDVFDSISSLISPQHPMVYVWTLGGHASGKSYTVFGDASYEERGLVFRTIEKMLYQENTDERNYLYMSMYLIDPSENLVDVLSNCSVYSFQNNLSWHPSLGVLAMPIKIQTTRTVATASELVRLGLRAAALYIASSTHVLGRYQTVLKLWSVHAQEESTSALIDSPVHSITFIEASSFETYASVNRAIDRLNGKSIRNRSARCMHDLISSPKLNKKTSVLSYLLADSLEYAESIFIGCLRPVNGEYVDNIITMDFLNNLGEIKSQMNVNHGSIQLVFLVDLISQVEKELKNCQELIRRRKAAEFMNRPSDDPFAEEEDKDSRSKATQVQDAWHCQVDRVKCAKQKIDHLQEWKEMLTNPNRAVSHTVRSANFLLDWLGCFKVFTGRHSRDLFKLVLSRKDKHQTESAIEEKDADDHYASETIATTPSTPYFLSVSSCGYSFPPVCFVIAVGPNVISNGHVANYFPKIESIETRRGAQFADDASIITLCGSGVDSFEHCRITRHGDGNSLSLEPRHRKNAAGATTLPVFVNGKFVTTDVAIYHNDILCFGHSYFVLVQIPGVAKRILEEDSESLSVEQSSIILSKWEQCLQHYSSETLSKQLNLAVASTVSFSEGMTDRYAELIARQYNSNNKEVFTFGNLSVSHSLSEHITNFYISTLHEIILAIYVGNSWAEELSRDEVCMSLVYRLVAVEGATGKSPQQDSCFNVKITLNATETFVVAPEILCSCGKGSWYWDVNTFRSRFDNMADVYFDFKRRCSGDRIQLDQLYPPAVDPWKDTLDDELIGVSCLYLGSLSYLFDIDYCIGIVSFRGEEVGQLSIKARGWIDQIDNNSPAYIHLNNRVHLEEFIGERLIIILTFSEIMGIPSAVSSNIFVKFLFYHHVDVYKSARFYGLSCSPILDSSVRIEQVITEDFIEYIQREAVDIEVWGRRERKYSPYQTIISADEVGEPDDVFDLRKKRHQSDKFSSLGGEKNGVSEEKELDLMQVNLRRELIRAKAELLDKQRDLLFAQKLNRVQASQITESESAMAVSVTCIANLRDSLKISDDKIISLTEQLTSCNRTLQELQNLDTESPPFSDLPHSLSTKSFNVIKYRIKSGIALVNSFKSSGHLKSFKLGGTGRGSKLENVIEADSNVVRRQHILSQTCGIT